MRLPAASAARLFWHRLAGTHISVRHILIADVSIVAVLVAVSWLLPPADRADVVLSAVYLQLMLAPVFLATAAVPREADATTLPVWSGGHLVWLLSGVAFLSLLGFAYLLPVAWHDGWRELVVLSQLLLFVGSVCVTPTLLMLFARKRWGGNVSPALVGFLMLLLAPANMLAAGILQALFPQTSGLLEFLGITGFTLTFTFGVGPCLVAWLGTTWRARVIYDLRAEADYQRRRADTAVSERQALQAKLESLQAQIEPHFLYNTLANAQALVAKQPADAEAMLSSLIHYLRAALPKMRGKTSTLGQEFALAQAYLDIARIRFGHRLTVKVDLPEELVATEFPPLIVQTLVENALKHGVEPKVGPVTIVLEARLEREQLVVAVADDGVGFAVTKSGGGVGLRNTRERLRTLYGEQARLELAPNMPTGVVAVVRVPQQPASPVLGQTPAHRQEGECANG